MAQRKRTRRTKKRALAKHPEALTPGFDPEPADLDEGRTSAGVSERDLWRFFARHNRAWVARPRTFLDRVARLREEILVACHRAGATIARTADEADALRAGGRPGRYFRFRDGGLFWSDPEAPPHVLAARRDAERALGDLGAAGVFYRTGEEGKAAEEFERAARLYERAGARRLEPLASMGAAVDPKNATRERKRKAKEARETRDRDLFGFARATHAFLERDRGMVRRLSDLHKAMHDSTGAPHVPRGDPAFEYECRLAEFYDDYCETIRQDRDLPGEWVLRVPTPSRLAHVLPKRRLEAAGLRFVGWTR